MANRRMQDSDYLYDSEDDLIGLTSAFAPVKGPQSVEYDKGDEAIGLTGAFAPIVIDEDEDRSWTETGKWKNFDWASYKSEDAEDAEGVEEPVDQQSEGDAVEEAAEVEEASGTEEAPASEQTAAQSSERGAHAGGTSASTAGQSAGRGRHAAPDAEMSPRMQESRKRRRTLAILVAIVVLVIVGVAVFSVMTFSSSQEDAAHEAQQQQEAPKEQDMGDKLDDDTGNASVKLTDVPDLSPVLGMTSDDALKAIGHGAYITSNRDVDEKDNPIKKNLSVALVDEPGDSKTGSPTVYLALDKDGKVIQVGYSASAAALGFGSLSFVDAVSGEHVIEKTLGKIGVNVPEGSAVLPDDKKAYTTYDKDGTTVVRERYSFEGDVDVNGTPCAWSSVLSYDYKTQVLTGDLSDTVRIIYVYVTKK